MTTFILLCAVALGGKPDPIFADVAMVPAKPADSMATPPATPPIPDYTSLDPNALPTPGDPAFTSKHFGTFLPKSDRNGWPVFSSTLWLKDRDKYDSHPFNLKFFWKRNVDGSIDMKVKWAEDNEGQIFFCGPRADSVDEIVNPSLLPFEYAHESPITFTLKEGEFVVFGKRDAFVALCPQKYRGKFTFCFTEWWRFGFNPYLTPIPGSAKLSHR